MYMAGGGAGEEIRTLWGSRDDLQKVAGKHHRGAAVQIHAMFQASHIGDKVPEIAKAALTNRRARRGWMHVDDVGADRHVHGYRNCQASRLREHAALRKLRLTLGQKQAHPLPEAESGVHAVPK